MTKEDIHLDLKKMIISFKSNYKCIAIKDVRSNNAFMMIPIEKMELVFNKLNILSTHFVHFGCGIGPFETELQKMEPRYINNICNWKPDTQHELYLDNMPINIMKVTVGDSENHQVHYNPRIVPKPPEETQRLIFPFSEK